MDFGKFSTKSPAVKRLMREAHELREATDEYCARPLDDNLFEWHFTVQGPPATEFEGGLYHGRILLPSDYPMKPPNIILLTPNGRFEINKKICLSISGHHPETWQPSWSIRTALLALIAFMPTPGNGTIGSLDYTPEERKQLAHRSQAWDCIICGKMAYQLNREGTHNSVTQDESALIKNVVFKGEEPSESLDQSASKESNEVNAEGQKRMENIEGSKGDECCAGDESRDGGAAAIGVESVMLEGQQLKAQSSTNTTGSNALVESRSSNSCFDSISNVLIGVIVAAIAFLIYRRAFLM